MANGQKSKQQDIAVKTNLMMKNLVESMINFENRRKIQHHTQRRKGKVCSGNLSQS